MHAFIRLEITLARVDIIDSKVGESVGLSVGLFVGLSVGPVGAEDSLGAKDSLGAAVGGLVVGERVGDPVGGGGVGVASTNIFPSSHLIVVCCPFAILNFDPHDFLIATASSGTT